MTTDSIGQAKAGSQTSASIQWKGTAACIDIQCRCGTQGHFDGFFAANFECPSCHEVFGMAYELKLTAPHEDAKAVIFEAQAT